MALVALTASIALAEDPVYFPEEKLEIAVETTLGVPDPTPTDMRELSSLNANTLDIADLTGLERGTHLASLYLHRNEISDLSPLSELTSLKDLRLFGNQISDISALSRLAPLTSLSLSNNQVSDISPVSALTNLGALSLNNNQISDISAVSGSPRLTALWLRENQIADLPAVSGWAALRHLDLRDNQIGDISPLSELTNLQQLYLNGNPLNLDAYDIYIPQIADNNPGIAITYDPFTPIVKERLIFYKNSHFDDPSLHDHAIAVDKTPLLPGQAATFANYTSYDLGINGVIVDVAGLADPDALNSDTIGEYMQFRVGNNDDPDTWSDGPEVRTVNVRPDEGENGTDRLLLLAISVLVHLVHRAVECRTRNGTPVELET